MLLFFSVAVTDSITGTKTIYVSDNVCLNIAVTIDVYATVTFTFTATDTVSDNGDVTVTVVVCCSLIYF